MKLEDPEKLNSSSPKYFTDLEWLKIKKILDSESTKEVLWTQESLIEALASTTMDYIIILFREIRPFDKARTRSFQRIKLDSHPDSETGIYSIAAVKDFF